MYLLEKCETIFFILMNLATNVKPKYYMFVVELHINHSIDLPERHMIS